MHYPNFTNLICNNEKKNQQPAWKEWKWRNYDVMKWLHQL